MEKMMSFSKRYSICPFCFERINLQQVAFRCENTPARCLPENDAVLAQFIGVDTKIINKVINIPPPTGWLKKITAWLRVPREATCHACHKKTSTRLCPNCHSKLPYTMGAGKYFVFAIIGAKEAGKSHYISVLIEKIMNEVGGRFDCSLQPQDDQTIRRYREDFYKPVFIEGKTIQATRSVHAAPGARQPLIYTLSFGAKGFLRTRRDVVTIAFFDTAGEDLDAEETMQTENKYIYNSSGIILLLDPLQLAQVRAELPPNTPLPSKNTETEDLLIRVANLIRKAHRYSPTQWIDIPIAVVFSKMDALEPLLEGSCLNYPSKHDGYFDLNEFDSVNGEMEARVREWSGENLIKSVEHNFKNQAFFGLTALGCNPHGTQKIDKLRPRRVEEPFLWLLWKHKLISSHLSFWGKLTERIMNVLNKRFLLRVGAVIFATLLLWMSYHFWPTRTCSVEGYVQMANVPAGMYYPDEHPAVHTYLAGINKDKVVIYQDFLIQTGEVTVAEFRRFVKSGELSDEAIEKLGINWENVKDDRGRRYADNYPVSNVPWQFANQYAQWLSKQTACNLQLPTQAQWAAAVMSYANVQTTQKPKLRAIDTQKSTPDHLLFNREEWSRTSCDNDQGRLILGYDYYPYYNREDFERSARCALLRASSSIGFRLVKEPFSEQ
jgi:hypothetical protein